MNRIKELRAEKGIKQADLAKTLKVSQATMSGYETGKYEPDLETLKAIADYFSVSVDFVIGSAVSTPIPAKKIPVYDSVAAGLPIEAVENIVDYEEIDTALTSTGDYFGLRVKGSSMEPRIREGDVVIVRKQDDADTGDTAIVMVNGDSATIKRIKKEPSGISLIPNNPAYDILFYSVDDIERLPVRIIGKVVELRAKF